MNILGIDTSSKKLDIAITDGKDIFLNISLEGKERTSKNIVSSLKGLLDLEGIDISFVQGISVVKGPGSFTGLKIGMTLAKVLSYINNIPLIGVDLFEVIVYNYSFLNTGMEILIPSRRDEFYWARYDKCEKMPIRYRVIRKEMFKEELNREFWIYVPFKELKTEFVEWGFQNIIPGWYFQNKAFISAILGREKLINGQSDDPYTIEPLYIRKFPF